MSHQFLNIHTCFSGKSIHPTKNLFDVYLLFKGVGIKENQDIESISLADVVGEWPINQKRMWWEDARAKAFLDEVVFELSLGE